MKEKNFSLFEFLIPLFVGVLIVSNIIAQKFFDITVFGIPLSLDVGTLLLFPLLYIIGDVVPEVYGYAKSRRLIWYGFLTNLIAVAIFTLAVKMPSSEYFTSQDAFATILGATPWLTLASMTGYWCGSFINSYVMVRMKVWMVKWDPNHKWLPLRTICSTLVGEFVDTALFVSIATVFGIFPVELLLSLIITQWLIKTAVETLFTPLTVFVIRKFKTWENIDVTGTTSYNPFSIGKE